MSFGASSQTKAAQGQQAQVATSAQGNNTTANANSTALMGLGNNLFSTGAQTLQPATNFYNTILGGNQANTAAALQPNINQINSSNQQAIQSLSTLMPRGGGRYGTLFGAQYAPQSQISGLFNSARTAAPQQLANIGLQQQNLGTNLFGLGNSALQTGNQALGTASSADNSLLNYGIQQQQLTNSLFSSLGQGLMGGAQLGLTAAGVGGFG